MLTRKEVLSKDRGMDVNGEQGDTGKPDFEVVVVGAGFAGLCMAIKLKEEGRRHFVLLEKQPDVGGTWQVNSYPGCACDVPSHLYSYSFEPNPDWSRSYSRREEIWNYLRHCVDKYELRPHIRLATAVAEMRYDDRSGHWHILTEAGDALTAGVVVSGTGALSVPAFPNIKGLDRFRGRVFHSQNWDHDYELAGKTVAVIGTGASAIQFVPQIATQVATLHLFQRSPPWILPKWDRHIGRLARRLFRALPFAQRVNRIGLYWFLESRAVAFTRWRWLLRLFQLVARGHLKRQIDDADIANRVTPDYELGCKRVLLSNDYYPALNRANVHLIDQPVASIGEHSVTAADGRRFDVDAIILGTGFRASEPLPRGFIRGRHGRDILDAWQDGPEAYLGALIHGFPNLFLLAGPNTGLAHSSMVFMLESQVDFVMSGLRELGDVGRSQLDVRADVQQRYNTTIQGRLADSVWLQGGCSSWYLDKNGKNVALWPGFTWQFRRLTRRFRRRDFAINTHATDHQRSPAGDDAEQN